MDKINLDHILNRETIKADIIKILNDIPNNKNINKGIYLYGENGIGKTTFINNILKSLDYDIINYDSFDIRNKNLIEDIKSTNISNQNIISLFNGRNQKKVIVMDDINAMNNGDKGGINTLIKLIRFKKTKKQKKEIYTNNPIICIGNMESDKKIKEIMKVSHVIKLNKPTSKEITKIILTVLPSIDDKNLEFLVNYINSDLDKLDLFLNLYYKDNNILNYIFDIFANEYNNNDTKIIVQNLLTESYNINQHTFIIPETERTIVALLWHENIIDLNIDINVYLKILDNICFSDYVDRVIFQKQIWELNEMSSLIKTFYNSYIYHINNNKVMIKDIRFTKVLTKYSTEFNNYIFIQKICKSIGLDKKDMFLFFYDLLEKLSHDDIVKLVEIYEINKLDIKRIDKFINNSINNELELKDDLNAINNLDMPINNLDMPINNLDIDDFN